MWFPHHHYHHHLQHLAAVVIVSVAVESARIAVYHEQDTDETSCDAAVMLAPAALPVPA
jgi:hypothetical protein